MKRNIAELPDDVKAAIKTINGFIVPNGKSACLGMLSETEVLTRHMGAAVDAAESKWSSYRTMVINYFNDRCWSALPLDRMVDTLIPDNCLLRDPEIRPDIEKGVKKAIRSLMQDGFLRSRRAGAGSSKPNQTLYEVNYE